MNWISLVTESQLSQLLEQSHLQPQVIFKHSTRCGTSGLVKSRLERSGFTGGDLDFYLLDVIKTRSLSNKIADDLDVWHESPQIILIKNGKAVYDESHMGIRMDEVNDQYASLINK